MKIKDYIIRGGENLNASPLKTSSFPDDVEQIFDNWHTKLGKMMKRKRIIWNFLSTNNIVFLFVHSI